MSTATLAPSVLLAHDVGVSASRTRRQFTAAYKLRIITAADACTKPGDVAALLRREGLYSSHLATWRAAHRRSELTGSAAPRRGPAPRQSNPEADAARKRIAELERQLARATARAERAEALVEVQKA